MSYFNPKSEKSWKHSRGCNFFPVWILKEAVYRAIDDLVRGYAEPKSWGDMFREKKVMGYSSKITFWGLSILYEKISYRNLTWWTGSLFRFFSEILTTCPLPRPKIWQKTWFLTLLLVGSHLVTTGHIWSHIAFLVTPSAGHNWSYLVTTGTIWSHLILSGHMLYCMFNYCDYYSFSSKFTLCHNWSHLAT